MARGLRATGQDRPRPKTTNLSMLQIQVNLWWIIKCLLLLLLFLLFLLLLLLLLFFHAIILFLFNYIFSVLSIAMRVFLLQSMHDSLQQGSWSTQHIANRLCPGSWATKGVWRLRDCEGLKMLADLQMLVLLRLKQSYILFYSTMLVRVPFGLFPILEECDWFVEGTGYVYVS